LDCPEEDIGSSAQSASGSAIDARRTRMRMRISRRP
jgi:hypothetical protein